MWTLFEARRLQQGGEILFDPHIQHKGTREMGKREACGPSGSPTNRGMPKSGRWGISAPSLDLPVGIGGGFALLLVIFISPG
ncbi:hypothetical protein D3C86_1870740 [compost metagenome]